MSYLLAEPEPAPEPLAGVFVVLEGVVFDAEPEPEAEPADGALSAVLGASANDTTAAEARSEPARTTVLRSFVMAAAIAAGMPTGSREIESLSRGVSWPKASAGHIADPTRFWLNKTR